MVWSGATSLLAAHRIRFLQLKLFSVVSSSHSPLKQTLGRSHLMIFFRLFLCIILYIDSQSFRVPKGLFPQATFVSLLYQILKAPIYLYSLPKNNKQQQQLKLPQQCTRPATDILCTRIWTTAVVPVQPWDQIIQSYQLGKGD